LGVSSVNATVYFIKPLRVRLYLYSRGLFTRACTTYAIETLGFEWTKKVIFLGSPGDDIVGNLLLYFIAL